MLNQLSRELSGSSDVARRRAPGAGAGAGGDRSSGAGRFAREHRVTQVVLGQAPRSRLEILLRGSLINRLLREAPGVDVQVVADRTAST